MCQNKTVAVTYSNVEFYTGIGLAVTSTIFIGASFIIKKKALIRLQAHGGLRAGSGGFGYLKEWLWWAGLLCMGIGEIANFTAYAFAPASLVTPLGALSILVAAILASKFLNERLNLLGKLGCFLCIVGSTVIVLHSPKSDEIQDLSILFLRMQSSEFVLYVVFVIIVSLLISCVYGPRYGHRNVTIYILLCSAIGSLSVMSCKGFGLAIRETLNGMNQIDNGMIWFCLLSVVTCVSLQMNYLNKALDLFSTGIVTPVYYVFFTSLVIISSSILFGEWEHMTANSVIGSLCGFSTVVVAIVMLNGLKDVDVSLHDLPTTLKKLPEDVKNKTSSEDHEPLVPSCYVSAYET